MICAKELIPLLICEYVAVVLNSAFSVYDSFSHSPALYRLNQLLAGYREREGEVRMTGILKASKLYNTGRFRL